MRKFKAIVPTYFETLLTLSSIKVDKVIFSTLTMDYQFLHCGENNFAKQSPSGIIVLDLTWLAPGAISTKKNTSGTIMVLIQMKGNY